ncbi:MAG TPA: GNAT family N-acetyltransferase [Terriglobales bacterium]|nr:GNAT family N-acetyltransferase [Terriglobales bacterium]
MSPDFVLLDGAIWNALSTRHAAFAEGDELAKRYLPEVTLLAAVRDFSAEALASLARVILPGEIAALFLETVPAFPAELTLVRQVSLTQMIWTAPVEVRENVSIETLGLVNVDEMLALIELTKPGPFGKRTPELGTYLGIRDGGRLVSMAGERLQLPGFTEVSAVCTHPDYRGRGYARMLISSLVRRIQQRGEVPFLHAASENTGAIRVYEGLGFTTRSLSTVVVVGKD